MYDGCSPDSGMVALAGFMECTYRYLAVPYRFLYYSVIYITLLYMMLVTDYERSFHLGDAAVLFVCGVRM